MIDGLTLGVSYAGEVAVSALEREWEGQGKDGDIYRESLD